MLSVVLKSHLRNGKNVENKPGISWGVCAPVNLLRIGKKGFAAIDFCGGRKLLQIFKSRNIYEHYQMMKQLTIWNYGSCSLCPDVKLAMDNEE